MKTCCDLSVVIPCYNEEGNLRELEQRTRSVLERLDLSYEMIIVNDGSTDRSRVVGLELAQKNPCVKIIDLSRNFGHQAAVTAGLDFSKGSSVVVMDADLQDPPEAIADMVIKWKEGYDVVYGQRRKREGEDSFKLFTAKIFYRMMRRLAKVDIPVDTGDFRIMDRKAVDALGRMREQHRFIRGMVSWVGFRQTAILYDRKPRFAGSTKYPFRKMFLFSIDAFTSFSVIPLRLIALFGVITLVVAGTMSLITLLCKWINPGYFIPGFTAQVLLIMFFGGAQLFSLGVIGEYIGRIFEATKDRPLYLVANVYERSTGGEQK